MSISKRWAVLGASLALAASVLALSLVLMVGLARAQTGSISDIVTYYGGVPGMHQIYVAVHTDPHQPPAPGMVDNLPSPGGSYTIGKLADGTYYVSAFLDANDSGGPPDPGEPLAWYDPDGDGNPDPVTVAGGAVTGIDIALGGPWLPTGGATIAGGQVGALAVHPAISGTLYTAVQPPGAGWDMPSTIYRSTNGAANWTAIYTAPHRIRGLAVTDTVIYAGAYNRDESNPQPVIYRSTDGGLSWTTPLSIADGVIWALDVYPTLTQTAVAGGGDYPDKAMLYQTTDSGDTWTEVFSYTNPGWYPTVNAVLIHPTTPLTWLLSHDGEVNATWGSYIWRSTDGGATWTEVYTITEDIFTSLIANPVTPTTIYASTWNNNFYRSIDGGLAWSAVITDGSAGERLVLDPPNTLYATRGSEVRKSTDEGDSWSTVGNVPGDLRCLTIDLGPTPSALYAGLNERGVYKSTNGGADWEERNNGIQIQLEVIYLPIILKNY